MENFSIPQAYHDREQALVKHLLLKSYLEKLMLIMGAGTKKRMGVELCYVDCFAGPWKDDSEAMESTSIAISLRTLESCRQQLEKLGHHVKMRALYIEQNARAFARLERYLNENTPGAIESSCLKGDFVQLRTEILRWVGTGSFCFFFVDPKGWTEVGISTLQPLLRRPKSEFLINLMYDFVNRTLSMIDRKADMTELLGEALDLTGLSPREREQKVIQTYRRNLKSRIPSSNPRFPPRAAHVQVMDPEKNRPKYHLVYLTSHPRGAIEFKAISEPVEKVQHMVRAEKRASRKQQQTGMGDLFGSKGFFDSDAGHARTADVDHFWCTHLKDGPRAIDTHAFADILEETDWFESDLQASLVRLIATGKVTNLSADAKRRKKRPLHYEGQGEKLQWTGLE
ncbi:three-Cys-motif partner protein TcmP [Burkholderia pseudomallei]|uniref:three-Cys-motif partner protein TcmP n=1 Tax=Burkholderia pseudomallei TaxID=28450 RepID=UPI0005D946D3|nr:three-Cys-motif partner protein TcmP [Burkholderia pseudomallei]AJX94894.1 three-Cys-motif partner family protein [Burkholderia pseudomallei PB08298010]